MNVKKLKILEFSDVHLNHRKTSTRHVLDNLTKAFPNNSTMADVDIIFFAGDFFDSLMHLPDPDVFEIRLWINRFLRICFKYDIVLRILEGTPSHDWKQSRLFTHINDIAQIGADVKYFEILDIEHNERFGIDILYVPDEWNPECDDTWVEVTQLLAEKNLTQVDFSVMHGAFSYQLPEHVPASTHDPDRYLSITRHLIFIGHIHHFSVYERIIAAGSIDRLTHGEEDPKGHVEALIHQDGRHEINFVENKGAKIYKTIRCTRLDVDKALKRIDKVLKTLPQDSHIRIEAARTDAILSNMQLLKTKYPEFNFTSKHDKETEPKKQTVIDIKETFQPVPITKSNIEKMLIDRLKEKGVDASTLTRAKELLNGYVG